MVGMYTDDSLFIFGLAYVWFLFLKLFLRTIFETIENIILLFSKYCSCYLNLVFSVFFMFLRTKKVGTKHVLYVFLLIFQNKINFQKQ